LDTRAKPRVTKVWNWIGAPTPIAGGRWNPPAIKREPAAVDALFNEREWAKLLRLCKALGTVKLDADAFSIRAGKKCHEQA
jgi:hypothetical protein